MSRFAGARCPSEVLHFERAIRGGTECGGQAAHNPVQQAHAETRNRKTQTLLNAGFRKGMRKLTRSYQLAKRMGRDSNDPRFYREIPLFLPMAVQNPVQLMHETTA